MQARRLTRRRILQLTAGLGANALLVACAPRLARRAASTTPEIPDAPGRVTATDGTPGAMSATEEPRVREYGYGPIEIEVWYQDWEGANNLLGRVAETYAEENAEATITLQAISYSDLYFGLLPAIAAGDEGDVLMLYTSWVAGTEITDVFLDITGVLGGYAAFTERFWEAPLSIVNAPRERVLYLPWLAGVRGAVITVNRDHLDEAGIDPLDFRAWEEVIDAGRQLTRRGADGTMTRAGYAINASQPILLHHIIWQLGGSMYDSVTGRWSWYSDEGIEGVRRLTDVYWTDETSSHDLYATELQGVTDGLISIWGEGAWTAAVQAQTAGIPAENVVTPRIADGVTDDLYPGHLAGWGLSRKLVNDLDKLAVARDFALAVVGPDAMVPFFDEQSSLCASKDVYTDPRIDYAAFGAMSRRVAPELWGRARYNGDRVGEKGPAYDELDRALRKEIGADEALRRMDAYCQAQEDAARDGAGQ